MDKQQEIINLLKQILIDDYGWTKEELKMYIDARIE